MTENQPNTKTFEDSLKLLEIENVFDRKIYRPLAYRVALPLSSTPVTPNAVTIVSIFIGVFAALFFYYQNIWINLAGFAILLFANLLDCVDGQLARLTGIKSEVGRILDGLAGDFWFIAIYICIALRLTVEIDSSALAWTMAWAAGLSNLVQANITDYYKTAHLYFTSKKKGEEFESLEKIKARYQAMPQGINKLLYRLYVYYTALQTKITPQFQALLHSLWARYGEDFPEDVRIRLRKKSMKVMPLINMTTFNWRSVYLLFAILIQQLWVYLFIEFFILNVLLVIAIYRHEHSCKEFEV